MNPRRVRGSGGQITAWKAHGERASPPRCIVCRGNNQQHVLYAMDGAATSPSRRSSFNGVNVDRLLLEYVLRAGGDVRAAAIRAGDDGGGSGADQHEDSDTGEQGRRAAPPTRRRGTCRWRDAWRCAVRFDGSAVCWGPDGSRQQPDRGRAWRKLALVVRGRAGGLGVASATPRAPRWRYALLLRGSGTWPSRSWHGRRGFRVRSPCRP